MPGFKSAIHARGLEDVVRGKSKDGPTLLTFSVHGHLKDLDFLISY